MPTLMKKGNGEVLVHEEKVTEYLAMGYSVIDSKGKVIRHPDPQTPAEFRERIAQYRKTIDALTGENAKLKADLCDAQAQIVELTAARTVSSAEGAVETVEPSISHVMSANEPTGENKRKNRKLVES